MGEKKTFLRSFQNQVAGATTEVENVFESLVKLRDLKTDTLLDNK